ncbi:MAG: PASTA domain-containing protein [Pseudomonadota bacterium]
MYGLVFLIVYASATIVTVSLLVRSGGEVTVPSVLGLGRDEAREQLVSAGLRTGSFSEMPSSDVPLGHVLQQSVSPGERVREGRSVGLVLSKGPRERSAPRLVGLDSRAVSVVLASSELSPGPVSRSCSEEIPSGLVIAQDPQPGETTTSDSVRTLLSTGRCSDRYVIPDYSGKGFAATARTLREEGFTVSSIPGNVSDKPEGTVLGQDPAVGAFVSPADEIRLTVAGAPPSPEGGTSGEGQLVFVTIPASPAFFRKEGVLRVDRPEPFGVSVIDFLQTPGNNSEFAVWLMPGSEVSVTLNGQEVWRKTYPWQ